MYEDSYAPVAELVDVTDLGSVAERRVGSSPTRCTMALATCGEQGLFAKQIERYGALGSEPSKAA